MNKETTEDGLWGIREDFLEEVIFKLKFEGSRGVRQALDSSLSIHISECHHYQVALCTSYQSPSIYLSFKFTYHFLRTSFLLVPMY